MPNSVDSYYEMERRFLISDPSVLDGYDGNLVVQAYLFNKDGFVVRVRRTHLPDLAGSYREGPAVLAVKGPRRDGKREEYELQVPSGFAGQLIARAAHKISKSRYQVVANDQIWDIDRFHGDNEGLIIAECESATPSQLVVPEWCGVEVTHDGRYNNESLAVAPISTWR